MVGFWFGVGVFKMDVRREEGKGEMGRRGWKFIAVVICFGGMDTNSHGV